jgi:transcriptional regulator with XRE-family HTH domain
LSIKLFHLDNYLKTKELIAYHRAVRRFGENVKTIRERRGLSQEQVAERLGLKRQANLPRLENGNEIPSPARILALAVALECEPGELLEDVETEYDKLRKRGAGKQKAAG